MKKPKGKHAMQLLVWELDSDFPEYFLGLNRRHPDFVEFARGAIKVAEEGARAHDFPICYWVITCTDPTAGEVGAAPSLSAMAEKRDSMWHKYNLSDLQMICSEPFWERISAIAAHCPHCRAEADGAPTSKNHLH